MFNALKAYADLIKLALIGLACLAVLVFYEGIPWVLDGRVDRARNEGTRIERLAWEAAQTKLRAEMEAERAKAQAEIDRIELDLFDAEKRANLAETALEDAIHENENAGGAAAPAFPKRLSVPLDAVGR